MAPKADSVLAEAPTAADSMVALKTMRRRLKYGWVVQRLVLAAVTLLLVSMLIFAATQILPGDAAQAVLGKDATPQALAELRARLHLTDSIPVQYLRWGASLLRGDLGTSLTTNDTVSSIVEPRLVNSLVLIVLSLVVIVPVALLIGVKTATRRDSRFDKIAFNIMNVINAIPEFVIAILLLTLLSTTVLHLFPSVALIPDGDTALSHLDALVLPCATLTIVCVPYLARLIRACMIDALESDYVQVALLKGLSRDRVVWRHALSNAMVPAIQGLAQVIAYLAGGIVVVEFLFAYPGLGSGLTQAVSNRDVPTIQAIVLILAATYVLANLCADLLTVLVTPRLRTGGR